MPSVIIHPDQTTKQPVVWLCSNPQCSGQKYSFEFESDYPVCPKCGNNGYPNVQKRVLVHLLLSDPKGNVQGERGSRWRLACDSGREHLATHTNGEAASGSLEACNCPGCLTAIGNRIKTNPGRGLTDADLKIK